MYRGFAYVDAFGRISIKNLFVFLISSICIIAYIPTTYLNKFHLTSTIFDEYLCIIRPSVCNFLNPNPTFLRLYNILFLLSCEEMLFSMTCVDLYVLDWNFVCRYYNFDYENNQQDALYRLIYYSKSALHVSGDVFAHHQEHLTVFTVSGSVYPQYFTNIYT